MWHQGINSLAELSTCQTSFLTLNIHRQSNVQALIKPKLAARVYKAGYKLAQNF